MPDDHATIQAAIAAAVDGDVVLVRPGTYLEHDVDFLGKRVVVRSEAGPDVTVIDAQGLGRGVLFVSGESVGTILEGFTITGGQAPHGVPVFCSAGGDGGGLLVIDSSPQVVDCIVTGNAAGNGATCSSFGNWGTPGGDGGGLAVSGASWPRFVRTRFVSNRAGRGGDCVAQSAVYFPIGTFEGRGGNGGGAFVSGSGFSEMLHCTFEANQAGSAGWKEGEGLFPIYCFTFSPGVTGGSGGGLYVDGGVRLQGCLVVDNVGGAGGHGGMAYHVWGELGGDRNGGPGGAGGLALADTAHVELFDCIVVGNVGGRGGWGGAGIDGEPGPDALGFECLGSGIGDGGDGGPGGPGHRGGDGGVGGIAAPVPPGAWVSFGTLVLGNEAGPAGQGGYGGPGGPGGAPCPDGGSWGDPGPDGPPGESGGRLGGGLHLIEEGPGSMLVTNGIVRGNDPTQVDGAVSDIVFVHSDVEGGSTGIGNIDADPLFVDAAQRDFRLQPGSPCVDAGSNTLPWDALDLDCDCNSTEPHASDAGRSQRFWDDPFTPDTGSGVAPIVDIGPHEFGAPSIDATCDVVVVPPELFAPGTTEGDHWGSGLAVLGQVALVGASQCDLDEDREGLVVAFEGTGTSWNPTATLTAPTPVAVDLFGEHVVLTSDWAFVTASSPARVVPFSRAGDDWVPSSAAVPPDPVFHGFFGHAIAADGEHLVVGAPKLRDDVWQTAYQGAVQAFRWDGAAWTHVQQLRASDGGPLNGHEFGQSVAVCGDTLVVGAWEDTWDVQAEPHVGAAYVYRFDGSTWTDEHKLQAGDADEDSWFGASVDVEGDLLVVGAPSAYGPQPYSGAVYVFRREGAGWTQEAKLVASDGTYGDRFGRAVDLRDDLLVVAAPMRDSSGVYAFRWNGSTWIEETILTSLASCGCRELGTSVAAGNGFVLAGAPYADIVGEDSGAAVAFPLNWTVLGHALAGSTGEPRLRGAGVLEPGGLVTFVLTNARPGASAWFVLGLSEWNAAFKGGVMVPAVDHYVPALPVDGTGRIVFGANWPAGVPAGVAVAYQYWIQDPAGPVGWAASNGLRSTTL